MRLPHQPENLASMRDRYGAAREPLYDQVAVSEGRQAIPGELRPHVFDFDDGIRLMVSRERTPDGDVVLHLSASVEEDSELYRWIKKGRVGVNEFCFAVIKKWRAISDSKAEVTFIGISSPKGCPHWFVEE